MSENLNVNIVYLPAIVFVKILDRLDVATISVIPGAKRSKGSKSEATGFIRPF